jgi:putative addiction module component (TIGR02574 family)
MTTKEKLIKEVLALPVREKSDLIEQLIESLDRPDPSIDILWKKEAEKRLDAYYEGKHEAVTVGEAFKKYLR